MCKAGREVFLPKGDSTKHWHKRVILYLSQWLFFLCLSLYKLHSVKTAVSVISSCKAAKCESFDRDDSFYEHEHVKVSRSSKDNGVIDGGPNLSHGVFLDICLGFSFWVIIIIIDLWVIHLICSSSEFGATTIKPINLLSLAVRTMPCVLYIIETDSTLSLPLGSTLDMAASSQWVFTLTSLVKTSEYDNMKCYFNVQRVFLYSDYRFNN